MACCGNRAGPSTATAFGIIATDAMLALGDLRSLAADYPELACNPWLASALKILSNAERIENEWREARG